jgi:hypothetical protein
MYVHKAIIRPLFPGHSSFSDPKISVRVFFICRTMGYFRILLHILMVLNAKQIYCFFKRSDHNIILSLFESKNTNILIQQSTFSNIHDFSVPPCAWLHQWAQNKRVQQNVTENNKSLSGRIRRTTRELVTDYTLCINCIQIWIHFVFKFTFSLKWQC